MLLTKNSIYQYIQSTPRKCIGYGAMVVLTVWQQDRLKNYRAIVIEQSSPYYKKVQDYLSSILRWNRDLCCSFYNKTQQNSDKVQYGLMMIMVGGLSIIAYKNQDRLILLPMSLVNFSRYNLLALKNKLIAH